MSTLRLTTISNQDGSATVPSQTVISGSAKAWINFDGTGTVAIRAAFNVSSITDNGTGDYTLNFTTALSDANYAIVCLNAQSSGNSPVNIAKNLNRTDTASLVNIVCCQTSVRIDLAQNNIAIFR